MSNIESSFNQKSLFAHLVNTELENSKSALASNIVEKILLMESYGWCIHDDIVHKIDQIIDESYLNIHTELNALIAEMCG